MKIIFVCGCIEPGKDGVGDYTRRLAAELLIRGHDVGMMSINDKYRSSSKCEFQRSGDQEISVLRLPADSPQKKIVFYAKKWLKDLQPDWVSLQFVPFAFHKKGIPINLSRQLKAAFPAAKWHIMFHELWVGMKDDSSLKTKTWGLIQKQLIKSLIKRLKPLRIQTHTQLYLAKLKAAGSEVTQLPLFGNIPVISTDAPRPSNNQINLLHFGSIYPNAPVKQFAKDLSEYADRSDIHITLNILGRSGAEKKHWMYHFKKAGLSICDLGERPASEIANIIASADIGIATTAYALIEKSGSAAAMREFGLPVICVSEPWKAAGPFTTQNVPGILEYQHGKLFDLAIAKRTIPPTIGIAATTDNFLRTLS